MFILWYNKKCKMRHYLNNISISKSSWNLQKFLLDFVQETSTITTSRNKVHEEDKMSHPLIAYTTSIINKLAYTTKEVKISLVCAIETRSQKVCVLELISPKDLGDKRRRNETGLTFQTFYYLLSVLIHLFSTFCVRTIGSSGSKKFC